MTKNTALLVVEPLCFFAVLAIVLLIGLPMFRRIRRHFPSINVTLNFPKTLIGILLLNCLLNVAGISWGLPDFQGWTVDESVAGFRGWAPDEITPALVQSGIAQGFVFGDDKYPPFHYYLLTLAYLPFYLLARLHLLHIDSFTTYTALFYVGRLISVLMGTAIVFIVYCCGRELYETRAALFAALIAALIAPSAYYAKIVNLDIPYIFWFVCSLWFYIRILKQRRLADYLGFAVTAVISVCTKDQAYGLYVLSPVVIVLSRYVTDRSAKPPRKFFAALVNRETASALAAAVIVFLVVHNIFFKPEIFIRHFKIVTGPASEGYKIYANTLTGHAEMLWQSVKHLRFCFGCR